MATSSLLREAREANEAFSELTLGLARKVADLQELCMLCSLGRGGEDTLRRLARQVDSTAERVGSLEALVDDELSHAVRAKELVEAMRHNKRQAGMLGHRFASDEPQQRERQGPEHGEGASSDAGAADEENPDEASDDEVGAAGNPDVHAGTLRVPSESNLNKVPRYMRGRLTLDKLEVAVGLINQAIEKKRRLVSMPSSKQSVAVREQVLEWRDQESEETEGVFFVTLDDILGEGVSDLNGMKSALQVLRFLGPLKLVSGGGYSRYCLV